MRRYHWFALLALPVVAWRVLAYRTPDSLVIIAEGLAVPIAGLGLLYLICGLVAYLMRPGTATFLFYLHGLGAAVHWGGSIGSSSRGLELALFFIYLAASLLGEAALLHLALVYGSDGKPRGFVMTLLYAPAVLATLAAPLAPALPASALEPIAGIFLLVATLFGIGAGVIFIVRLVRADAATRRRDGLGIIVGVMVVSTAIELLGSGGVLPGPDDAYNLAYALIPVGMLIALTRRLPASLD